MFTTESARQAVLAFNGDVYEGLKADELSDEQLQWTQDHLVILSGLYGALRPLDLMRPYRLEMGTRLANPQGKNLYEFWGTKIEATLLNVPPSKKRGCGVVKSGIRRILQGGGYTCRRAARGAMCVSRREEWRLEDH